ncbi:MAG: DNA polymerase III subunit delta [Candidatus Latescibacteria bacterium]|nr:DNA polymerase III subunit delta [Candidatus Latescibacterota bacterium]
MKSDEFSNVRVVLFSGEEFQRSERLAEVLGIVLDEGTLDFNLDVFTPETFSLDTVAELIVTFPMMAERRVIVIRNFDKIHPDTRKKAGKVIADTPESTFVAIEGEKASLVPKPPTKYFKAEIFKPVYENRLPTWIQGRFSKRGKKATSGAVALLINNAGTVLRELDSEIEKVTIAAHEKELITEQDVSMVVGEFRHDTVWNLCNAVGLGDFDSAAGILTSLMESEKNRETFYIATLAAHIMKIAEYNNLIKKGVSRREAMKVVTNSEFLWKLNRMDAQARNFGQQEIRRILSLFARTDSMLKRYSVDKRLVMELLIPLILPEQKRARRA